MKKITLSLLLIAFCLIGLVGCTNTETGPKLTPEERVEKAAAALVFTKVQDGDFELPTSLVEGVTATWESKNTDVIVIIDRKGVTYADVINPDENVEVELVATLTYGSAEVTRTFTFVVRHQDKYEVTIKDIHEGQVPSGKIAIVSGKITMVSPYAESYGNFSVLIEDEGYAIMLYRVKASVEGYAEYKIGSSVSVEAEYSPYQGLHELASCTVTFLDDKTEEATFVELEAAPEDWNLYQNRLVRIPLVYQSGTVQHKNEGSLVMKDKNGVEVAMYPHTDWGTLEDVTLVPGQEVVVTGFVNYFNRGQITQVPGFTYIQATELSDEQKLAALKLDIEKAVSASVTENFELPATVSETPITWTMVGESTAAVLDGNTVTVTRPALGETDVTVTFQYAFDFNGPQTGTVEVVVKALEPSVFSIASIYTKAVGDKVTTQGVVTAIGVVTNGKFSMLISDGEAGVFLYNLAEAEYANYKVGDEVQVEAQVAIFRGLYELSNCVVTVLGTKEVPAVVDLEKLPTDLLKLQSQIVKIELTVSVDGGTVTYKDADGTAIAIYVDKKWREYAIPTTLIDGQTVTVTGFVNWFNNAQLTAVSGHEFMVTGSVTPEQQAAAMKLAVEGSVKDTVTENFTLVGTENGTTVTWSVQSGTAITLDGLNAVVTRPAAGEEDAKVVLAYTFTYNETQYTGTVEVTVSAEVTVVQGLPADLNFSGLANRESSDDYLTKTCNWTVTTGLMGETYLNYAGFGRSGQSPTTIQSPEFSATEAFTVTVVLKGNPSNNTMTSYLNFNLVDGTGAVVAKGKVKSNTDTTTAVGATDIVPLMSKDCTIEIEFEFESGKTIADVTNLQITFTKLVGNIGWASLVWNKQ